MTKSKISPQTARIALSEFTSCIEYMSPEEAMSRAIYAAFEAEGIKPARKK